MSSRLLGVALCALAQNLAFGSLFGSFGPLLPKTIETFDVSMVSAMMAMSLATLATAGGAPIIGVIMQRTSARHAMCVAALGSAFCFATIAVTASFALVLICYALLGLCAVTLGIIGPVTLVNRWFEDGKGRVLGLIHMPLLLTVSPIFIAQLLPVTGRTGILIGIAGLFAVLAPLMFLWLPEERDGQPSPAARPIETEKPAERFDVRRTMALILLSLAVGIIAASSVIYMAHAVPFGLSRGLSLESAALLISLYSGFGVAGSPVTGWLTDRLGAYWTMIQAAAVIAIGWALLPAVEGNTIFVIASFLGFFACPINTMHAAAVSDLYDAPRVGRAMGVSYLLKLPLLFGSAPLVAIAVAHYGAYRPAFIIVGACISISAVFTVATIVAARRLPSASPAARG